MAKEKKSASRKYLKVLGIISLIAAICVLIFGIVLIAAKDSYTLDQIGMASIIDSVEGATENDIKVVLGAIFIVYGIFEGLGGWLLLRAAKNPTKTTLLFVLLLIEVISGIYSLIQSATGGVSMSSAALSIVSLTISVLALFATYKARSEAKQ